MTAKHNRAARRERQTAKALGGVRVTNRPVYFSAPDILPVKLASGCVLTVEVKSRKRLPSLVTKSLAQASKYLPSAVPVAVLYPLGGTGVVCLALADFRKLLGLEAAPAQNPLPFGGAP